MTSRALLAIGTILLAAGLVVGLSGATAHGTSCGSAFAPSDHASVMDYANAYGGVSTDLAGQCADTLSGRRTVSLALLVSGVIALAAAGAIAIGTRARTHELERQATSSE